MSKLNSNKINFNEDDFLVETSDDVIAQSHISKQELLLNRFQDKVDNEIETAQKKAQEIIENAKNEAQNQAKTIVDNAQNEASRILDEARNEAQNIIEQANIEKNELLVNAQEEIEKSSQEGANKGYEEGYKDAQDKFFEENEEKIRAFDEFCLKQYIIKDKILKNASREILNIIQNISKAVLLKEVDSNSLDKIIQKTITLFDKKENITIILSEKYANILYELQNKKSDIELNFENFKQYKGFEVVYNKELPEDTIIIENNAERFCASIGQQLDKIIREINQNTQNGNIDIEEYNETSELE